MGVKDKDLTPFEVLSAAVFMASISFLEGLDNLISPES
jgi:hypothetical protein